MRSGFEKHFLSLKFATKGSARRCLDSCTFDSEQDAYLPDVNWISDNDEDECVIYCCMLNTSYISFKDQQSKVDELKCELKRINLWYSNVKLQLENKEIDSAIDAKKIDELQKRVDEITNIATELAEYASYAEIVGGVTVNRSAVRSFCDKIFDLNRKVNQDLEQALKGGSNHE